MRHIKSLLLSIAATPLIYLLLLQGTYQYKTVASGSADPAGAGADWQSTLGIGAAMLVAAGLLAAGLLLVRLSPVGPLVSGLILSAVGVFTALHPDWAGNHHIGPVDLHTGESTAVGPLTMALAIPLLMTAALPARWRPAEALEGGSGRASKGSAAEEGSFDSSSYDSSFGASSYDSASSYGSSSFGSSSFGSSFDSSPSFDSPSPGLATRSGSDSDAWSSLAVDDSSSGFNAFQSSDDSDSYHPAHGDRDA